MLSYRVPGSNIAAHHTDRASRGRRRATDLRLEAAFGLIALLAALGVLTGTSAAQGVARTKHVRYHGYTLVVPAAWPVYHLTTGSHACVRFDRHAVYLGRPAADQSCPAHAVGRTEAVLVEPAATTASASAGAAAQPLPSAAPSAGAPSSVRFLGAARGVVVTATWGDDPALIRRLLGVRSLTTPAPAADRARAAPAPRATSAQAGEIYTGLGFDACSTPSPAQMSAWSSSPYRAIGVYIGGTNMACSQSNLTASWTSQESALGWHLIPIYVGLQAPTNSCGCAAISSSSATSQGTAAASDAITQAQAIGLGSGNPIYFDMEAYPTGGRNTSAVLAFLAAWTTQLHAGGYTSGVYSSSNSGISDLVSQFGTSYQEPDDLWIANWNGAQNTSDPNVPSTEWSNHQRLHQYSGGHDEKYGGVTINIDGNYLDGATAAAAAPVVAASPSLSVSPAPDGSINLYPSWAGASGISAWQVLGGSSPTSLTPAATPISASATPPIVMHSAYAYFAVSALGTAGQTLGTSAPVATPAHVAIFGKNAFASQRGLGGLPVGCFGATPCEVTTTISAGRRTLARTGPEMIPVGGGLAYFSLSATAKAMLASAAHHRVAATMAVTDASGTTISRQLSLVRFTMTGRGPRRSIRQSAGLRIIGVTDFVWGGWVGGILVACSAASPCHASTKISTRGKVIATTQPEFLGTGELGYVFFSLTPAGHKLLTHAPGNQLPAQVKITNAGDTAGADIALVAFR